MTSINLHFIKLFGDVHFHSIVQGFYTIIETRKRKGWIIKRNDKVDDGFDIKVISKRIAKFNSQPPFIALHYLLQSDSIKVQCRLYFIPTFPITLIKMISSYIPNVSTSPHHHSHSSPVYLVLSTLIYKCDSALPSLYHTYSCTIVQLSTDHFIISSMNKRSSSTTTSDTKRWNKRSK